MKNKTTRFLLASLAGVALLCVCVFSFLAVHMSGQSAATINKVGTLYMSGMSEQTAIHFENIIGLRMEQLDVLVSTSPAEKVHIDQAARDELIHNALARDFTYLAFYKTDGTLEMLYGSALEVTESESFLTALTQGEKKISIGTTAEGEKVVLLGVPATHPPTEDHPCVALVAGLPITYISDNLSLDENEEKMYCVIIRRDGTFVIRTFDEFHSSSFERVHALYEDVSGMTPDPL